MTSLNKVSSPVLTPQKLTPGDTTAYTNIAKFYDARPPKYAKNVLLRVCIFLFFCATLANLAHFGVAQSLKNMFMKLGWSNKGSNSMKITMDSLSQFSCVLAGYFADERIGKYKTLLLCSCAIVLALVPVAISALPSVVAHVAVSKVLFCVGIFLGDGLFQSSITAVLVSFGGDQFAPSAPHEQKVTYFGYIFWAGCIGTFLSYLLFPSLSLHGVGAIPPEYGYFAVYTAGFLLMLVVVSILLFSRKRFVHLPPTRNSISQVIHVVWVHAQHSLRARMIAFGTLAYVFAMALNIPAAFLSDHRETSRSLSFCAGGLALFGTFTWVYFGRDSSFLDSAKDTHGGRFDAQLVEDVKKVIRVLPFNAFNAFWGMMQNQRANNQTMIQQTDVRLGHHPTSYQIPGPTMQAMNPLSSVILIPLLANVIYPFYTRVIGRPPSNFGKMLTGYIIAAIAMVWSGVFEIFRRNAGPITYLDATGKPHFLLNNDGHQVMNNISWVTAIPQYFILSLAGTIIIVPWYEISYSEVPASMRGTSVAIVYFVMAMGSAMQSSIVLLLGEYITPNLNNGHLEYLFFTMAGIMVVVIFLYIYVMQQMQFGMLPHDKQDHKSRNSTSHEETQ